MNYLIENLTESAIDLQHVVANIFNQASIIPLKSLTNFETSKPNLSEIIEEYLKENFKSPKKLFLSQINEHFMNDTKLQKHLSECQSLREVVQASRNHALLYEIFGVIIFILGIFGNLSGVFFMTISNRLKNKGFRIESRTSTSTINNNNITQSRKNSSPTTNNDIDLSINPPTRAQKLKFTLINKYKYLLGGLPQHGTKEKKGRIKRNYGMYFMNSFYLVNLINVVGLLFSPILEYFGTQDIIRWKFWYGKPWIFYQTHLHNPIFKPFVVWSFLIYVLYFACQMFAIRFPMKYKNILTIKKVRIAMSLTFIYSVIWYLPTFSWRIMIRSHRCYENNFFQEAFLKNQSFKNVNQTIRNLVKSININEYELTYFTYVIYTPSDARLKKITVSYQILRELFTKILPFGIIVTCKILSISIRKKVMERTLIEETHVVRYKENNSEYAWSPVVEKQNPNSNIKLKVHDHKNVVCPQSPNLSSNPNVGEQSSPKSILKQMNLNDKTSCWPQEYIKKQTSWSREYIEKHTIIMKEPTTSSPVVGVITRFSPPSSFSKRKTDIDIVTKSQKITLLILSLEFLFLMMPVSIIQMIMDFLIPTHDLNRLLYLYTIFNILEFIYISCSFYINILFNPYYRREIGRIIKLIRHSIKLNTIINQD